MPSIYLPGRGSVDIAALAVDRAIKQYDERLFFGRNDETGDWCAFIQAPHGHPPVPVFGWQEIPHPEDAVKRLYEADTVRHGSSILDRINRDNEAIRKEKRWASSEATGDTAERIEHALRKAGRSPIIKSMPLRPRR